MPRTAVMAVQLPTADGDVAVTGPRIADRRRLRTSSAGLQETRDRFAAAFAHAPIGMALVDPAGALLTVNDALAAIAGRGRDELCALPFGALVGGVDDGLRAALMAGERDAYEREACCVRPDGTVAWVHLAVSAVRGSGGETWCCLAQLQDITARRSAEEQLRRYVAHLDRLGRVDPLTGLPAREGVVGALRAAIAAGPGSLVVLRQAGDLAAAAEALGEACRPGEVVGVTGPGELAVVLPGAGPDAAGMRAAQLAERAGERSGRGVGAPGLTTWRSRRAAPQLVLARARAAAPAPPPADATRIGPRGVRILELVREQLGMDAAFLAGADGDALTLLGAAGDAAAFGLQPGDRIAAPAGGEAGVGAHVAVPLVVDGAPGTLFCLDRTARPDVGPRELGLLRSLAGLLAETLAEEEDAERRRRADSEGAGINALLAALAARDQYTGDHTQSVVLLATEVAARLGLPEPDRSEVEQVAMLHDIGKVGIPDAILQKQGSLDPLEWELMRQHSLIGERVIAGIPGLAHLAPAVRAEHERWDGAGYPDHLREDAIPLTSRIALVCDAYHAMTSDRPYRARLDEATALDELRRGAGTQFDPVVVDALLTVLRASTTR